MPWTARRQGWCGSDGPARRSAAARQRRGGRGGAPPDRERAPLAARARAARLRSTRTRRPFASRRCTKSARTPRSCRTSRTSPTQWSPVVMILFFTRAHLLDVAHAEGDAAHQAAADQAGSRQSVSFADIAGVDEAKAELPEIVEFLRDPQPFTGAGREGAEGHPPARAARHRQDAAGEGRRARVGSAVLRPVGGVVRGDVRRARRGSHPAPVRGRAQARTGDHLHRRARRRGRAPRDGRLRREGPDAQPAAGRDGRLRHERARGRDRRLEPAREARPGAAAPRAASTARCSSCRPTSRAAKACSRCTRATSRSRTSTSRSWPSRRAG